MTHEDPKYCPSAYNRLFHYKFTSKPIGSLKENYLEIIILEISE